MRLWEIVKSWFTCPPRLHYRNEVVECLSHDLDCRECWREYRQEADHD